MWHMLVVTSMVAVTGFYALSATETVASSTVAMQKSRAENLAQEMALYRQAVTTYFRMNPESIYNTVNLTQLKDAGALPAWSTLTEKNLVWSHFRYKNRIYVFATDSLPVNILPELGALSYNSQMIGQYQKGKDKLISPFFGPLGLDAPPPGLQRIPDGSPVWVS